MSRLPDLKPEDMDEKQRAVFGRSGAASRGGTGRGPSHAMLYSPDFAERATSLGDVVLKQSSVGRRLAELAILVTARHLSSSFEWWVHARVAAENGIDGAVIEAIRTHRTPTFSKEDERVVYNLSLELNRDRKVSDKTFDEAKTLFELRGVVDLVGVVGCYTMFAMFIATFELEPPENPLDA